MKEKIKAFQEELSRCGCAVLVGPLLEKKELTLIDDKPIITVDGGLEKALKHHLLASRSHFSVGDGDSSNLPLEHHLPTEKNFSDLAYGLSLIPKEVSLVKLFGFLGGRRDHELANLGEVYKFLLSRDEQTQLFFSNQICVLSSGTWSLKHTGLFSLMTLSQTEVSLTGAIRYKLERPTALGPLSSLGLSNHATGNFELICDHPVFLYGEGLEVVSS